MERGSRTGNAPRLMRKHPEKMNCRNQLLIFHVCVCVEFGVWVIAHSYDLSALHKPQMCFVKGFGQFHYASQYGSSIFTLWLILKT